MKVILLKDIKGVGQRFDEKEVSSGYASNFLFPQKLALPVSNASLAQIKNLKEKSENKREANQKEIDEKEAKRMEKHLALEKFRQEQRS